MNPRKKKPVLFELFARAHRARGRSLGQRSGGGTTPSNGRALPGSPPAPAPGPQAGAPAPTLWKYAAGRLHLVLAWPYLAVIGVVLLIIAITAFQIGRRSGQPPAPKSTADLTELLTPPTPAAAPRTETPLPTPAPKRTGGPVATPPTAPGESGAAAKVAARAQPEAKEAKPAEPKEKPKPKEADAGDNFNFTANSHYVVVQHFRIRDRDRAVAAKEFLRSKGVECVIRPGGGDLELVATEAFSSEPAARDLVKRILDLGKEYWNSGGGYEFTGAKARKF